MSDALTQAEQTADRIRGELLKTLEELDRRRENLTDWRAQVRSNKKVLITAASVVGGYAALVIGYRLYERHKWGSHRNHLRVKAAKRAWHRPEQVARPSDRPATATLLLSVVGAFATTFAATLAKKAATKTLETGGEKKVTLPSMPRRERIVIQ